MGYSWSQQDETVGAGFKRIATEQIAKAVHNADAVNDPPARRIHAARRHCKRLRGLFRLVRSDFPDYRPANAAVRDAAAILSTVRDATVLRQTLERLYSWTGYPLAKAHRHETDHAELEAAALMSFRRRMAMLLGEAEGWTIKKIDVSTLGRGYERCYGRAVKTAERCRDKPTDDLFHDWRKLVKYHSFHLILLKSCLGEGVREEIEKVEHLAGLLGRHHDLAVLRHVVRTEPEKLGGELDTAFVDAHAALLQDHLGARAFVLSGEIFARPPRIARGSLEARWHAWWHSAPVEEPA
ncbi:MAG TPA: CHAD domain-containing protein [Devosia sp.]